MSYDLSHVQTLPPDGAGFRFLGANFTFQVNHHMNNGVVDITQAGLWVDGIENPIFLANVLRNMLENPDELDDKLQVLIPLIQWLNAEEAARNEAEFEHILADMLNVWKTDVADFLAQFGFNVQEQE